MRIEDEDRADLRAVAVGAESESPLSLSCITSTSQLAEECWDKDNSSISINGRDPFKHTDMRGSIAEDEGSEVSTVIVLLFSPLCFVLKTVCLLSLLDVWEEMYTDSSYGTKNGSFSFGQSWVMSDKMESRNNSWSVTRAFGVGKQRECNGAKWYLAWGGSSGLAPFESPNP